MKITVVLLLIIALILIGGCDSFSNYISFSKNSVSQCEEISKQIELQKLKDEEIKRFQSSLNQTEPINKKEITSCQENKECMFVPKSCEDLNLGIPASINARFSEYWWNNQLKECRVGTIQLLDYIQGYSVYSYYWILEKINPKALEQMRSFQYNHRPACTINNRCSIIKIPVQEDVYDCYFNVAVSTDDVTLCNKTDRKTECVYGVAMHSKNPDLCKEILTEFPGCYHDVLCDKNKLGCQSKVEKQIKKDFPEIANSDGDYAVCIDNNFDSKIKHLSSKNDLIKRFLVTYDVRSTHGVGHNYLQCFVIETDTPLFIIKMDNLIRDVPANYVVKGFYYNGFFHKPDLSNITFFKSVPHVVAFNEGYKEASFDYDLYSDDCSFESSIYNEIAELSKENLNLCSDIDSYLKPKNYFGFTNKCKFILRNNFIIKCKDSYAINNVEQDVCSSYECKIKTATDFSLCEELYSDYPEQQECKIVIGLAIAKRTMDAEYCGGVQECVTEIAINKSNLDLCNSIQPDKRRFDCYEAVALNSKNNLVYNQLTKCENLQERPINVKLYCYRSYAFILKDSAYCDKLGIGTKAEECYQDLAKITME